MVVVFNDEPNFFLLQVFGRRHVRYLQTESESERLIAPHISGSLSSARGVTPHA